MWNLITKFVHNNYYLDMRNNYLLIYTFCFLGHSGAITTISFSENGYYLATAADDACVKLWDLRKLRNFKTLQLDEGYQIKDLCFDQSGTYLAVAGSDVRYVKVIKYYFNSTFDLVILKWQFFNMMHHCNIAKCFPLERFI